VLSISRPAATFQLPHITYQLTASSSEAAVAVSQLTDIWKQCSTEQIMTGIYQWQDAEMYQRVYKSFLPAAQT